VGPQLAEAYGARGAAMAGGMAGSSLRSDVSVYRLPFDLAYLPEPHVALGHGIGAQAAGTGGAVTIACLQRLLWKWGRICRTSGTYSLATGAGAT
jgi:hypothetical protein